MVILVDNHDHEIGVMPKMEAHQKGALHRAFSLLIFNTRGELLLQRRALDKYHSGGLWTNTCCGHPLPGEATADAAVRRLAEEMGMQAVLDRHHAFTYRTQLPNGLQEHEIDHVYTGVSDDLPSINPEEVAEFRYLSPGEIDRSMQEDPEQYSVWFRIIWNDFRRHEDPVQF